MMMSLCAQRDEMKETEETRTLIHINSYFNRRKFSGWQQRLLLLVHAAVRCCCTDGRMRAESECKLVHPRIAYLVVQINHSLLDVQTIYSESSLNSPIIHLKASPTTSLHSSTILKVTPYGKVKTGTFPWPSFPPPTEDVALHRIVSLS